MLLQHRLARPFFHERGRPVLRDAERTTLNPSRRAKPTPKPNPKEKESHEKALEKTANDRNRDAATRARRQAGLHASEGARAIRGTLTGLLMSAHLISAWHTRSFFFHSSTTSPSTRRLNRIINSRCTRMSVASTISSNSLRNWAPERGLSRSASRPW